MTFEPGATVAGYRIERLLGRGGMGTVYLAHQHSLKRPVALKLLSPQLSNDETFRVRFRREGEVQAALDHPHIVPIYEAGATADEHLYIAMRFVRGSTLKELIEAADLDAGRTLRLLRPIAGALDAAHASGLIHRDVKPQNVLVDQTDWPYLADFGLTRGGGAGPTRSGQIVGTFAYIAPEQIKGRPASPRSDQYALAAVLFESLTGDVPHSQDSDAALLYAKVHEEAPRLSDRNADLPRELDDVLARGMARDPDDRFPSATALVQAAIDVVERPASRATPANPGRREQPGTPSTERDARPPPVEQSAASDPAKRPQVIATGRKAAGAAAVGQDTVLMQPAQAATRIRHSISLRRATRTTTALPPPVAHAKARPAWLNARVLGIGAGIVLACGALGAVAAPSNSGDETRREIVRAGGIVLRAPLGWVPARSTPELAGLSLRRVRAYAPPEGGAAAMVVGAVNASGTTLLPAAFERTLAESPRGQAVQMGRLEALRYTGLRPRGVDGPLTMLVAPSTTGVITAVCLGTSAERAACEAALASARAGGATKPLTLAPRPGYARQVNAVLANLGRDKTNIMATLKRTKTRPGQARLIGRLANRYAQAGRAFSKLKLVGPRERAAQSRVGRDLTEVAEAMRAIRSAADRGDQAAYRRARSAVQRREDAVHTSLREFKKVGYKVG